MSKTKNIGPLEVVEIGLVVAAQQNNPSILNADFLKFNKIVDSAWSVLGAPLTSAVYSQVVFDNGIMISALPDKVLFVHQLKDQKLNTRVLSEIAERYIKILPHVEYRQVGINPKVFAPMPAPSGSETGFVVSKFLMPAPWRDLGKKAPTAGLQISFTLDDCLLNLSIEEGELKLNDKPSMQGLLFAANFHRELEGSTREDRTSHLLSVIKEFEKDLTMLVDLIDNKLLGGGDRACA